MPGSRRTPGNVVGATAVAGLTAMYGAACATSAFVSGIVPRTASLRELGARSPVAAARPHAATSSTGFAAAVGGALAVAASCRRYRKSIAVQAEKDPEIDPRRSDPPNQAPPVRMPTIEGPGGEKLDVMSKLLQDRIIILGGEVKDEMAQVLVAQMLYLANQSSEDITMYINSPGGSVSAGLAIYDTMQFIPCEINTVCFGMAASMGSFLLSAGTKGKRKSLPNSRIMIHQPLGGAQGQASDVRIQAQEILHLRQILNMHLADATGKSPEQIEKDCDRDNFMTPEEAKAYGLIDDIIETKAWPRIQKPPRPQL